MINDLIYLLAFLYISGIVLFTISGIIVIIAVKYPDKYPKFYDISIKLSSILILAGGFGLFFAIILTTILGFITFIN